ncbi:PTS transporter subunit EIIB [[Acholeplasma] multilocale]|nr:PTS transporter subunit EIIB [[Acholeplasma] multilocale]
MAKKKDYAKDAKHLFEALGGYDNIESFFHCMTRRECTP